MSRAKEAGGGRVEVFAAHMHADAVRRLELAAELRQAITDGSLAIEYQPWSSWPRPASPGSRRWSAGRRTGSRCRPGEFLGVAEDSGLIVPLGDWVLREACRQVAAWRASGWQIGLSVNFSLRQVSTARFAETVLAALDDSGLPYGALTLEVTEQVLVEGAEPMVAGLSELRRHGVRLAIDDFGTGYASLAYLRELPVDIIKIDPSFVAGLGIDGTLALLTRTIVQVGHDLGIEVVAEGIERPEQLELLRAMGCGLGQGYLVARPMTARGIEDLAAAERTRPGRAGRRRRRMAWMSRPRRCGPAACPPGTSRPPRMCRAARTPAAASPPTRTRTCRHAGAARRPPLRPLRAGRRRSPAPAGRRARCPRLSGHRRQGTRLCPDPSSWSRRSSRPAGIALLDATFEVRYADGSDRSQLLPALADADAVIVRSATDIDAEAIAAAPRLQVVARAGVGLDNIDVEAATKAGIMVVNAPTSNIVSAAEHAVALLLALARHVPQAMASLRRGEWQRAAFTGVELHGKVAGILGLGKVGVLVAERLAAFGMTVVAYDPYVAAARASELGVRLAGLNELLAEADFISIHLPRTADTIGLLGDRELHLVKPRGADRQRGARRDRGRGGAGQRAGQRPGGRRRAGRLRPRAVHRQPAVRPSTTSSSPRTWAPARRRRRRRPGRTWPGRSGWPWPASSSRTPSTCRAARWPRRSGPACRWPSSSAGSSPPWPAGVAARVEVEVLGDIAAHDVRVLQLAAMKGIFLDSVAEQVTYVNAPLIARERGVAVSLSTALECPDWRNLIRLRGTLPGGQVISVSGTLTGLRQAAKIVEINGFATELAPADHMMFLSYTDRPGVVGVVGQILGDRQINIAGMQVCRDARGGEALIALTVDSAVPRRRAREDHRRDRRHRGPGRRPDR